MIIIGIDTGGTFTDFIYKDKDKWAFINVYPHALIGSTIERK